MDKKQTILEALEGKKTSFTPVGAWYAWYDLETELTDGLKHPEFIRDVINRHGKFIRKFHPDIVKIMTAGYFRYPGFETIDFRDLSTLRNVRSLGESHPWISQQTELSKSIASQLGREGVLLYNIFSPFTYLRFLAESKGSKEDALIEYIETDPKGLHTALEAITGDLLELVKLVLSEGRSDGIFLPVRNLSTNEYMKRYYSEYIEPYEKRVLAAANTVSRFNVLHICGSKRRNDLTVYRDYDADIVNWAAEREGISLEQGQSLFPGKVLLGGFSNERGSLIETGSKEEIENETRRLLDVKYQKGIILGFDCALPPTVPLEHINWVRRAAT